ncbi:MAG: hypothetical protein FWG63_02950 [Defluviitaleaceae bacterium]|nr:hypothetical protein [Defluviitaleaceae bacterium]
MAKVIAIMGESGAGKTTACRNLNPLEFSAYKVIGNIHDNPELSESEVQVNENS